MRRRGFRGFALSEVIIASTVLLLMLGVASASLIAFLRATQSLGPHSRQVRELAHALETLTHRLHSSAVRVSPPLAQLRAGYRPVLGQTAPLVLRCQSAHGPQELELTWEPKTRQLLWNEGSGQQRQPLVICQGLQVWVTEEGPFEVLTLQLEPLDSTVPWLTTLSLLSARKP